MQPKGSNDEKVEEFIQLMKGIHYMLQLLVTHNRSSVEIGRVNEEQKQGGGAMFAHL